MKAFKGEALIQPCAMLPELAGQASTGPMHWSADSWYDIDCLHCPNMTGLLTHLSHAQHSQVAAPALVEVDDGGCWHEGSGIPGSSKQQAPNRAASNDARLCCQMTRLGHIISMCGHHHCHALCTNQLVAVHVGSWLHVVYGFKSRQRHVPREHLLLFLVFAVP